MTLARNFSMWTIAGLAVLLAALFLSPYNLDVLTLVVAYTVAALAQNLLAGYADVPSLGNVTFFATSAFTAAWLISLGNVSPSLAIVAGIAAAGILGLVVGLPSLRISGMHLAVVTVALVFVGQELMTQWDTAHGVGSVTVALPPVLEGRGLFLAASVLAFLAYLLVWNLLRSRTGRAIRALSDNPYAAAAAGIDVVRYRLTAFVLSGVLTGAAGAVYLFYALTVTPGAFSLNLSLAFLTMMIFGGSRSLGGSLTGAFIIGLLPQLLGHLSGQVGQLSLKDSTVAVYSLLLLVTLRFFPDGVWNGVAALRARKSKRETTSP